jgi:hypothetical protein
MQCPNDGDDAGIVVVRHGPDAPIPATGFLKIPLGPSQLAGDMASTARGP